MYDWQIGKYLRQWVMDDDKVKLGNYLVHVTKWGALTGFYMKRTSTTPPKKWQNSAISNYEHWRSTKR